MSAVWLKPELEEIGRGALTFTAADAKIMHWRLSQRDRSTGTSAKAAAAQSPN
jgi:hypothetical protein